MNCGIRSWLPIGIVLLATAIVYWPGLSGGYLFDDMPNFVDNPDVHVTTLDWNDWRRAALASPSPTLRRPLAMLSLATNYYFTRLDPFPVKLTNLCIHLANGVLLWRVMLLLLSLWNARNEKTVSESGIQVAALLIASAWMLAPINVTGVLYAVQRMASMAQFFVLAGLQLYLRGRRQMLTNGRGIGVAATGLIFGAGLGLLCKETAVLLPVYAFLIELTVLRLGAATLTSGRMLRGLYMFSLVVPAAIGLFWLMPQWLSESAYARRPFTLSERLLTETRVLLDYVRWTLVPDPRALSFYHDDISLSRSWLSPPSTLACALGILAIIGAAAALARRFPLIALGVGWYFAAHLLTATVIPLELVFEHRNYFASIGLLLAVAGTLLSLPAKIPVIMYGTPIVGIMIFAVVTALRAQEWSHPVKLAVAEAAKHPNSPRANYELGRALIIASDYRQSSQLIEPAISAFERAATLTGSGAPAYASLIFVAGHLKREAKSEWWDGLTRELNEQPPSSEAVSALTALATCQRRRQCPSDPQRMLTAFSAALSHPNPSVQLLSTYGAFLANELKDYANAARVLSIALRMNRADFGIRLSLVKVLLLQNNLENARRVLAGFHESRLSKPELGEIAKLLEQEPALGTGDLTAH